MRRRVAISASAGFCATMLANRAARITMDAATLFSLAGMLVHPGRLRVPCLLLASFFGPVGLVLYLGIRTTATSSLRRVPA